MYFHFLSFIMCKAGELTTLYWTFLCSHFMELFMPLQITLNKKDRYLKEKTNLLQIDRQLIYVIFGLKAFYGTFLCSDFMKLFMPLQITLNKKDRYLEENQTCRLIYTRQLDICYVIFGLISFYWTFLCPHFMKLFMPLQITLKRKKDIYLKEKQTCRSQIVSYMLYIIYGLIWPSIGHFSAPTS